MHFVSGGCHSSLGDKLEERAMYMASLSFRTSFYHSRDCNLE